MTKKSRVWAALLGFVGVLLSSSPVFAQAVGDACSLPAGQMVRERGIGAAAGIVCNGTTFEAFQNYAMSPLRHGINMSASPEATLDVNGEIRVSSTAIACSGTNAGAIRYSGGYIQWCNGTAWANIASGAGASAIDDLSDAETDYVTNFNMSLGSEYLPTALGQFNISLGQGAGNSITSGGSNIAIGYDALTATTNRGDNIAIGYHAMFSATNARENIVIGTRAMENGGTGDDNVFIGFRTGESSTGSNNILLGSLTATPAAGTNSWLNIGDTITANLTTDSVGIGMGTTTPASKFVVAPPATQTIAAAATITANACGTIKPIDSITGSLTTNTTNTFTSPTSSYAGCCMDVINVDTADTITLDANAKFKTAGGVDQALSPDDTLRVCSNGTNWYQVGAISANQ